MHGPGNLEVLDIPAVDFVQAREPGGRKILVMVQPVARLLIGIKQALWCNVVRASGRSVGYASSRGKHDRKDASVHNRSAAFEACHGCSSFDGFCFAACARHIRAYSSVQRTASSLRLLRAIT